MYINIRKSFQSFDAANQLNMEMMQLQMKL